MFLCKSCWYNSANKLWKCPNCGDFWSFEQDLSKQSAKKSATKRYTLQKGNELQYWDKKPISFFKISDLEVSRVFKRWIKQSWVYLLWWEPWIWKSTIILQIIQDLIKSNSQINIWYFSGEESEDQIIDRMNRLQNWKESNQDLDVYHSTLLEDILTTIEVKWYDFVVFDSVQTIYSDSIDSPAGSANQVKYCSEKISEFCKNKWITAFIIWHVTKLWEIAWPKYLEHIVDVVLYLEWDRYWQLRFLRSQKNRFDSTDDVAIFEMSLFWLQPVYDLKERIINSANVSIPWSVLTVWIDNWRPVIVNLEVLLNKAKLKYPQRSAIWIDSQRLNLILAILERYLKINLWFMDVFVNIPWEFKFFDSGLDLAIAVAIYAQYKNKLTDKNKIYIWEIGLWGQVLKSKLHEKRSKETPKWFEVIDYSNVKNVVEIVNIV